MTYRKVDIVTKPENRNLNNWQMTENQNFGETTSIEAGKEILKA